MCTFCAKNKERCEHIWFAVIKMRRIVNLDKCEQEVVTLNKSVKSGKVIMVIKTMWGFPPVNRVRIEVTCVTQLGGFLQL